MSRMCWLLLLVGCDPAPIVMACPDWYADEDEDGYFDDTPIEVNRCDSTLAEKGWIPEDQLPEQVDCDDDNKDLHPDATEICDGLDNDCDDAVDLEDAGYAGPSAWWYLDADGDGHGVDTPSEGARVEACGEPDGYVVSNDDCDDHDPDAAPGAEESCAEPDVDHDCDGAPARDDDDTTDKLLLYRDSDGDGYGAANTDLSTPNPGWLLSCDPAHPGYAASADDCDDTDEARYTGAVEVCNGVDDDCDGLADNEDPNVTPGLDAQDWFHDVDNDGFGDGTPETACRSSVGPPGTTALSGDCDDRRSDVAPGRPELCDGADNDCDERTDAEDPGFEGTRTLWFPDGDGDGYGALPGVETCDGPPPGHVDLGGDCADDDATQHPGATERCDADSVDHDCDGLFPAEDPDAADRRVWYRDDDADGEGDLHADVADPNDPRWRLGCADAPPGHVPNRTDCDDRDPARNTAATELCNEQDDDCDGLTDDADLSLSIAEGRGYARYRDADGDGYGLTSETRLTCAADLPTGYAAEPGDCDDQRAHIAPGAEELCDGLDNDCDEAADLEDDGYAGPSAWWYLDEDGDGHGDDTRVEACREPDGYVVSNDDCDDGDPARYPGAEESCAVPDLDRDCDGVLAHLDTDVVGGTVWYADRDGDGHGAGAGGSFCEDPGSGWSRAGDDCDDVDATVYPRAEESCERPEVDHDCDRLPAKLETTIWVDLHPDRDGDGYGEGSAAAVRGCPDPTATPPLVADDRDCDDADFSAHPGANESCETPRADLNCDGTPGVLQPELMRGAILSYPDTDGDGYGDDAASGEARCAEAGWVLNASDCDDHDPRARPGGVESCEAPEVDRDCDGVLGVDQPERMTDAAFLYPDADRDGEGDAAATGAWRCRAVGWVNTQADCDDRAAVVRPGATEACNERDDDCDDLVDAADPDYASAPELCNGLDDDCDGLIDADDPDYNGPIGTWYADADRDGFGDSDTNVRACAAPTEGVWVTDATDCDDTNATTRPGAPESCADLDTDRSCDGVPARDQLDATTEAAPRYADADADGYGAGPATLACPADGLTEAGGDCDDSEADVHPGATEVCNDRDDDCDTLADLADLPTTTWHADADGDGYGDLGTASVVCDPAVTQGYVADATDCNDRNNAVNPGAIELCNGADDDCSGTPDDVGIDGPAWYADGDRDGFGAGLAVHQCTRPAGHVDVAGDCDDRSNLILPGAIERCDEVDNDCDGRTDNDDDDVLTPPTPGGLTRWWPDGDNDGYATGTGVPLLACAGPAAPPGYAAPPVLADCDDTNPAVHPGAAELCDDAEVDENCDRLINSQDPLIPLDPFTAGASMLWYPDNDGDGAGDAAGALYACADAPPDHVATADDCDGADAGVRPGAPETCAEPAVDHDCDGRPAFAVPGLLVDAVPTFPDRDDDGYGADVAAVSGCVMDGWSTEAGDCDDRDAELRPGAPELCNGADDDCDLLVDDADPGVSGATLAYADGDRDGYGDAASEASFCVMPADRVTDATDCDDNNALARPGAAESCADLDTDRSCDGVLARDQLDQVPGATLRYVDADSDGFGAGAATFTCSAAGFSEVGGDCDDGAASVRPGATEVCNDLDDNCDALVDESDPSVALTAWYADGDRDGFGGGDPVYACTQPAGRSTDNSDCDDTRSRVYPGAPERCDGEDNDCDGPVDNADADSPPIGGTVLWNADLDGDGFGDPADGQLLACSEATPPPGYAASEDDCDDGDFYVHPGAQEVCNAGVDDDCDGHPDSADEDVLGDPSATVLWYADADEDGFASDLVGVTACADPPAGYAARPANLVFDCDDDDSSSYPGAPELCDDVDQDCDGGRTWEPDTLMFLPVRALPIDGGAASEPPVDWTDLAPQDGSLPVLTLTEEGTLHICERSPSGGVRPPWTLRVDATAPLSIKGHADEGRRVAITNKRGTTTASWIIRSNNELSLSDLQVQEGAYNDGECASQGTQACSAVHHMSPLPLTVERCTFWRNGYGVPVAGGTNANGAGIGTNSEDVMMVDCLFDENWGWTGGGLLLRGVRGNADLLDVRFSRNQALYGGGLQAYQNTLNITCTTSQTGANAAFYANHASSAGAINANSAQYITIDGCSARQNTATNSGAVFLAHSGGFSFTMSDGDVDQNSAGGDALDTSYFTRTHIERVGFHTNRATGTDGRASSLFVGPEATVRQSTFEGNTCAGGASYWPSVIAVANQRSLTLDDVDFTNNTCTAVYASASAVVNITNSSFTGGRSDNLPAAIYMGPIAGYTTAGVVGSLTVSDTTFTDNWNRGASARGGAVFLNSPVGGGAPNPTIIASFTDSSFTQNRADIGGGAIDIFNTVRLTLDGASFTDNNGALGASSLQMRGDAPWPKATLTECIFEEDPSFEISNNGAAHNLTDGTHTLTCGTYNCSIP